MTHPGSGNSTWQSYPSTQTPITAAALESVETALDKMPGQVFFRCDLQTSYRHVNVAGDILAGGGWTIVKDTHNAGTVASGSGNTLYRIPVTGRLWDVMFTAVTNRQSVNSAFSAKVLLNGTSVSNNSLTSDYSELLGGESYVRAWRSAVPLAKDDILRWATWISIADSDIVVSRFGQPTQMIVRDAGPA